MLRVQAHIDCDDCGKTVFSETETSSIRASHLPIDVRYKAEKEGWTTISRGRYYTPTHWCKDCSSKPIKPVPRKKRAKADKPGI